MIAALLVVLSAPASPATANTSLGDYEDRFSFISYGNSMGSLPWDPDWQEVGDDGSAWTGAFRIGIEPFCPGVICLIIGKDGGDNNVSLARSADLSIADAATLTMDVQRHPHLGGAGRVRLSVADSPAGTWAILKEWPLDVADAAPIAEEFDLTPWISSTTTIQFEIIDGSDASHLNVDDLRIELFAEDNLAPALDPIADLVGPEETQLGFTATAVDPNAGDVLSFSLDGTEPAGAAITGGGVFTWTPTEAQGPGVYSFDVIVSDDGDPALADSQTVTITVDEVNASPNLDPIGDRWVEEGKLLSFSVSATDAETAGGALVYELVGGGPSGASMTPDGLFSWIPSESQGPGAYAIDVKVWDDAPTPAYDLETITVFVGEKNEPPSLSPIADKSIDEGLNLTFTAQVTDADLPANGFSFSLAGAPSGAAISPAGVVSWTPTDVQGPGVYTFDVVVVDDGDPALSDRETVTVTVAEANIAPNINPVAAKTVDEGATLQFTVSGSDADIPANSFTFSLDGAPTGASITPGGLFTWTPTENDGPGTFRFDAVATDNGVPPMSSSTEIAVTVAEVNTAPVLASIGPQSISEGALFSLQVTASDTDVPGNELTFTLDGAPRGATISQSGLLTWTPTEDQGPANFNFDVVVTDDGVPALSDSQTISVGVADANNAPVIDPIGQLAIAEGEMLTFLAQAADPDLPANSFWFSLGGDVPSGASITSGGLFSWVPDEAQGPGVYRFDVVATDTGTPPRSSKMPVTVVVAESNEPPQLYVLDEYAAEAGMPFLLAINATDPDLPAQQLTYSATGLPPNALLSPSGELTWTPDASTAGDSHPVEVTVTDSGEPARSTTADFVLKAVTANQAPDLAPIGDWQIEHGEMLTFVAVATDADGPSDALRFSLSPEAPVGAAIDPATGVFEWRPTLAQDGSEYTFAVRVTDGGVVPKSDSETLTITVGKSNAAPSVTALPDQRSMPGEAVTLAVVAHDPDSYPAALAFAASNLPPGVEIDGTTGKITGKAGFDALSESPFAVEVVVSDGRDSTSINFEWVIAGVANPPPATPARVAVVSGINQVTTAAVVPVEAADIGRSLVLMARAARDGVAEMSFPFILLIVMIAAIASLGRVGVVPIFRRRTRHEGVLLSFDPETGSGLVARLADGAEVFVHTSAVARRDRRDLRAGDDVVFRTVDGAYRDLVTKLRRRR